ncbi:MAG: peptidoglycan editing factor PgeF [Robiginitomaculum sp.]|nr:peptidoglycan editing factor PgeF [Robiginitomaculum sp.]
MTVLPIKFAPVFDSVTNIDHGFFGRGGGVSTGIYDSLNAGRGSNDNPEHVKENLKRIASALGTRPEQLLCNHQIHSTKIVMATTPWLPGDQPKADGIVTNVPGLAICALAADCAPVLFADPHAGVIGAAHAGWRGALAGVTDAAIDAMVTLGARRSQIRAAVGPCISQENYEVGPEFVGEFVSDNLGNGVFFRSEGTRSYFNLKAYLGDRLKRAGLRHIAAIPDCTYGHPDAYFSYRYNTHKGIADYGRNISAIMLNE